jgi:putative two-component system hydrogenase maturation factor HypX/HoxX
VQSRDGRAICRATVDGAVWITHLKPNGREPALKLPAAMVLGERLSGVPEVPLAPEAIVDWPTWRPIRYEEAGGVGFLHFPFYNGAMGKEQCEALRTALRAAKARPTRVIALMGGPDFWSNGIHLHRIEASGRPAEASWENINAIDDLVREIIDTDGQLTIAAMHGNAGAGGVFLALAADHVWARTGVILNPHYKGMGNLYGSEYWTYLLPRRVTPERAQALTQGRLPIDARQATAEGLVDEHFGETPEAFRAEVARRAQALAADPEFERWLADKSAGALDEAVKPRRTAPRSRPDEAQLFGFDPSYHVARYHSSTSAARDAVPLAGPAIAWARHWPDFCCATSIGAGALHGTILPARRGPWA